MKLIKILFIFLFSIFSVETYSQDKDGDGVLDHLDADADNDGIPNCIENGFDGDPNTAFKSNVDATAFTNLPGVAPLNQFRLTNGTSQRGQAWSYGKIDFTDSFSITMKVLLSGADGIAVVFQNDPSGTSASGIHGQGLGARGIVNGIALELDTFQNSCTNDANNGGNCDPSYDHGSIRITQGTATSGWTNLSGDGQLGDGTVDDGIWHTIVVTWDAVTRNLSYTFDGVPVTNYTFPEAGSNAIENIFGGTTNVRFGFTGSTGSAGSNNSIGFDNPCEIPLYFDTDGDGILDYLDLDSDNDGCTDAIEGGDNVLPDHLNPDGSINTSATGGIDSNGIPNLVNSGGAADVDGNPGQGIGYAWQAEINACTDEDNDGIPDTFDLDNDNDGILDTNECYGEKLINGSFTGNAAGWTLGGAWAYVGNQVENQNDTASNETLSQALSGSLSTQTYKLSFNLGVSDYGGTNTNLTASLTVKLGGVTYAVINNGTGNSNNVTISLSNGATSDFAPFSTSSSRVFRNITIYMPYTYSPSQMSTLEFSMTANGDDWFLDNISLMGGCDTDGDGTPDYLDLDSDEDGCYDAIEGDGDYVDSDLNPDGAINTTIYPVDTNGVPDNGNSQGIGTSQDDSVNSCPLPCTGTDTDGDGIPDMCDLDIDNDGILNDDECGSADKITNGIFPTSGGNTDTVAGWTVGGTYSAIWPSSIGRVNLNSNGLEFRRDGSTVTTLSQNLTGLYNPVISLGSVYWYRTVLGNDPAAASVFTVSYAGTVYATINVAGDTPTVTGNNGAIVSSSTLATLTTNDARSSKVDLSITLPANVPSSGALLFTFTAGSSSDSVRDLGMASVSVFGCQDTDGDGIPDYLDLDSDNDGCPDALEGDGIYTDNDLNPDGSLNITTYPIDGDGVPDNGNSQGIGQSQNSAVADCGCPNASGIDSDGDGIDDACDLDDDNDGILDTDECPVVFTSLLIANTDQGNLIQYNTTTHSFDTLCSGITFSDGLVGDIAMDSNGDIWGITSTNKLIRINPDNCAVTEVTDLGFPGTGLSFMPDGNLLAGSGSDAIVRKIDVTGGTYAAITWHDFNTGFANGDFIFIGNKVYVLWFDPLINPTNPVLLEAEIDADYNYVSHTVLGSLPRFTWGLGKVNGDQLYGVTGIGSDGPPNPQGTIIKINILPSFSWNTLSTYSEKMYGATSPDESILECDTDGDGIPDRLDLDSDGDGCPDALEGDGNYTNSDLNPDGSVNIGAYPIDEDGIPGNGNSQGIGDSQNAAVSSCPGACTKPGAVGAPLASSVGILTKGSNPSVSNWPESVPNGYLVLDSAFKGMVITHMTTDQIEALTPVEGMLVFDTDQHCVKLYRGTSPTVNPSAQGWVCIERICID